MRFRRRYKPACGYSRGLTPFKTADHADQSYGKEVTIAAPAPQRGGKVVDIMEAQKRSMEGIPAKKKPATTPT